MLIRNVELEGKIYSVRIQDGKIALIDFALDPMDKEHIIDGRGGALLPGLHDHHIHLNASAAALNSVRCGPPHVENMEQLVAALIAASGDGWLRGIGYHHSVAGEIDRRWLDEHGPDRPVRMQHRGGRMWVFNSRAIDLLDINIPTDGKLIDADAALRKALPATRPVLDVLIKKLHSFGITGVTEVTPGNNLADFEHYTAYEEQLNLTIMGSEKLHGLASTGNARPGPLKIHNHDHDLPPLADLTAQIANAHDHDRAVAIHCVTRAEMMLSLAAIKEAGVHFGDRIEHAAIADNDIIDQIAKLGLTVVTQPNFIAERQEAYLRDVESHEQPNLWRLRSFVDADVKMAAGSDAPFGDIDPWRAMASAVNRPSGFDQDEEITSEAALALYTKPTKDAGGIARKIAEGEAADLCLLDRSWLEASRDIGEVNVSATWVRGNLVYDNISSIKSHSSAV